MVQQNNPMKTIKVVQHNVHNWNTKKTNFSQTYREIDPDIILINSHGLNNTEIMKVPGFTTYKLTQLERCKTAALF